MLRWISGHSGSLDAQDHEAAGRWLRQVHDAPYEDTDIPLEEAFARRIPVGLDLDPTRFRGSRVHCHRDFHPDNWIAAPGALSPIDFEHSRPDHPTVDLVRLATEVWPRHPDLREAFAAGYGTWDPDVLDGLILLHAHRTLAWGLRHDDPHFIALGRRLLSPLP